MTMPAKRYTRLLAPHSMTWATGAGTLGLLGGNASLLGGNASLLDLGPHLGVDGLPVPPGDPVHEGANSWAPSPISRICKRF